MQRRKRARTCALKPLCWCAYAYMRTRTQREKNTHDMRTCTYICTRVHRRIHTFTHMHICTERVVFVGAPSGLVLLSSGAPSVTTTLDVHSCTHTRTRVQMHPNTCITHTHVQGTHVHAHTRTCAHTYTYTYTRAHALKQRSQKITRPEHSRLEPM